VDEVWTNWEQIKRAEKDGTQRARSSVLDGIPRHLPALLKSEKLVKKARKHGLMRRSRPGRLNRRALGEKLFALAACAQQHGWSAEALLRDECRRQERALRKKERTLNRKRTGH
jgi:uncharacterized protein YabN with tetrapyrrole methylase and pyrophosphatase domain